MVTRYFVNPGYLNTIIDPLNGLLVEIEVVKYADHLAAMVATLPEEAERLTKELTEIKTVAEGAVQYYEEKRKEAEALRVALNTADAERDRLRAALIQAIYMRAPYIEDKTGDPIKDGLREYMNLMEVEAIDAAREEG